MLRAALSRAASCPPSTSAFHTSAVARAGLTKAKQKARAIKRGNAELKAERERTVLAAQPHVVLGTRPGEEATFWANSDLARLILTRADIDAASPSAGARFDIGLQGGVASAVQLPPLLNYGVAGVQEEQLACVLPALSAQSAAGQGEGDLHKLLAREVHKANMLGRTIDLRNANAGGIAYENRRRIIAAFSEAGKVNDTGRPEVQAALLTLQIRNLWSHLTKFKKDIRNRRALRLLVHQRAKILKHLKKKDRDRYDIVLERLGLHQDAVEGELVV